jgi:T-complex protein 1 subunit eta
MSHLLQPNIILLKDGTDSSQGKGQLLSNITACVTIVNVMKTTLGPLGMDKLIYDGKSTTISNDGATIMNLLDIVHPAAKTLVDIAKSQDTEVGDGTTSVVILAGEFLLAAKQFIEDGIHPQVIIKAFRKCQTLVLSHLRKIAVDIKDLSKEEKRKKLVKCAKTTLNSKLIGGYYRSFFSNMVVDAIEVLDEDLNLDMVGIKKVSGGSMGDSFLVQGVAFKKTFSYAGFEQQPKSFKNPKIILLNIELELKSEKSTAEIRIKDPDQYQSIVDAEWELIYNKLNSIIKSGAQIVLSKLAIGDLATQYFADNDIFCAGRVDSEDCIRVSNATGAKIQTTVSDLSDEILGTCEFFEEKQVGNERYNIFKGCPKAKTCTIVIRGGAEQFIEETERSLHDAIMIVKRTVQNSSIVAGGGAIEMRLSKYLRDYSREVKGKQQFIINEYAKALEVIPKQLSENAGLDSIDILNKLRQKHSEEGGEWFGVDINNDGVCDTMKTYVWEPVIVKLNCIAAATQAAILILSIDETIKNPESEQVQHENMRGRGGMNMKNFR